MSGGGRGLGMKGGQRDKGRGPAWRTHGSRGDRVGTLLPQCWEDPESQGEREGAMVFSALGPMTA